MAKTFLIWIIVGAIFLLGGLEIFINLIGVIPVIGDALSNLGNGVIELLQLLGVIVIALIKSD